MSGLLEGRLQVVYGVEETRVEDGAEVGSLVDGAGHDIVVGDGGHVGGGVTVLLANHV